MSSRFSISCSFWATFSPCARISSTLPAVFALQAVQQRQPVRHLRQAVGRSVDALGIVAQRGSRVFRCDASRIQRRGRLLEFLVEPGQLLDLPGGGPQQDRRRRAAFVKLLIGAKGGGLEALGVGQDALFRFQLLVFFRLQAGLFDLLALEAPQVDLAQPVLLVALQLGHPPAELPQTHVQLGRGTGVDPGKGVQQGQPGRRVEGEGEHRLALGVYGAQPGRQLFQDADRGRLVVDEDASLAVGGDLAPQDQQAAVAVQSVGLQQGQGLFLVPLEGASDNRLLGPMADHPGRRLLPQQQGQSVDQQRLPRAGLAGQ